MTALPHSTTFIVALLRSVVEDGSITNTAHISPLTYPSALASSALQRPDGVSMLAAQTYDVDVGVHCTWTPEA